MGRTDAKKNQRSGQSTSGLRHKDLRLTIIFAPCSRSELMDIYNPIEFPNVDRQMRVISTELESSGAYVAEQQDKLIFINCGSAECYYMEESEDPLIVTTESLKEKLQRSIQLIHELLDSWHGYQGTVFTTFSCYHPLEELMVSLQAILNCPGSVASECSEFSAEATSTFSHSFDRYKQWTFVNKFSGVYKAIHHYEVHDDKPEAEKLKEENERLINSIKDEEVKQKFRDWYDAEVGSTTRTTKRLGVEGFVKYHSEYNKYLDAIDKNNRRLGEIDKENQEFAEKWGKKSRGQRIGYVEAQLNKKYDTGAVKQKYQPQLNEIKAKMRQLDYQDGTVNAYVWSDKLIERMDEAQTKYERGARLHQGEYEYHARNTIEYNGEYYTKEELSKMYVGMKGHMDATIAGMEAKKKQELKEAKDDIHKQMYIETFEAGLTIMNVVAIVFAPLTLVNLLVTTYKLAFTEQKLDGATLLSIGLDIFAVVPFVGAVAKAGGIGAKFVYGANRLTHLGKDGAIALALDAADNFAQGASKVTHASVAETIVNDLTKHGKRVRSSMTNAEIGEELIKNADNLGLSELSNMNSKIAAEEATADLLKEAASKTTKNFYNAAGKGDTISGAVQVENNLDKAGQLNVKGLEHQATAESLKATRQVAAINSINGHLQEVNQVIAGATPGIGGGFAEAFSGLPIVSLKGYISDVKMFIKNAKNMSGTARAQVAVNLAIQTGGQVGTAVGISGLKDISDHPSYTAESLGDDFILIVHN